MPAPLKIDPRTGDLYGKTAQVTDLLDRGQDLQALSVAKDFKIGFTAEERNTLRAGHGAATNPRFYLQLRKDPDALIRAAMDLLRARYTTH